MKRNKNDAADAEAICEAVTRPAMRFVAVKSTDQQSVLMEHRTHDRTRPHCTNLTITLAKGEPSTHDPERPFVMLG